MSTDDRTQIVLANGVQAGTQLNGIYEIDEKIAAGGMGEVYRGHNIQTGDPVAIKIVLPDFARDPTILALFRKEASVLNHLAHNAIVRYYVFSIDPGIARPYLAMEFVDGKSLAEVMHDGPLSVADAGLLIARIASGLAAAHEAGVVHRDLSPDNIILSGGSVAKAKIIDFGIARSETIGGGTLLGGRFAGKYNFVSPEQLGLFGGEVSERSDIYSLGLVFAAALRGEALDMSGSQVDVIEKRRVVPPLDSVPEAMRPVVEAMLQPDPADRPESMGLIVEWLTPAPAYHPAAAATVANTSPFERTVVTTPPSAPGSQRPTTGWPPDPQGMPRSLPPRSSPPPAAEAASYPQRSLPPGAPAFRSNPPRSLPPANPFDDRYADRSSVTTSVHPFAEETPAADDPVPAEEPYRYIPSNPEFFDPPFGEASGAERASAELRGGEERRETTGRRPLALYAAVALLVVAAAGATTYLAGIFAGDAGTAIVEAAPTSDRTAPPTETPDDVAAAGPSAASRPSVTQSQDRPGTTATADPPSSAAATTPPDAERQAATTPLGPGRDRFAGVGSAVEWLKTYDGGACFFARPLQVSDRSMSIEGFGRSIESFRAMDGAFRSANGYEPTIGVRQIAEPQCALADFMRQIGRDDAPIPDLDLSDDQIRSGESLQGVIAGLATRSVSLWLIDNQGIVYDLNQHLKRAGDRASFNIKLVDLKTGEPLPQLIFAVSSDIPLASLSHSEPKRLTSFLNGLRAEITRDDRLIGVAAKYFELGG